MCESTETRNKNLESYQCDLHLVSYLAKRFFFFFNVPSWSSACWEIKNAWLRHSPEFKRHLSIRSSDAFGWINPTNSIEPGKPGVINKKGVPERERQS